MVLRPTALSIPRSGDGALRSAFTCAADVGYARIEVNDALANIPAVVASRPAR
jgi:hypothetical protein